MHKALPIFAAQIAKLISTRTCYMIAALVFLYDVIALLASHEIQFILQYRNHGIVTFCKLPMSQIQAYSAIFS